MAYSAAILARAKARLAAAREQNAQDDAARIGAIYERLPRLRQIDLELQKTAAKVCAAAFRAGEDPSETIRQLKDENLRLQQERDWILESEGVEPDDLEQTAVCPRCGGSGYLGARMCECLAELCRQEQKKELSTLLGAGRESFDRFRLDYYPAEYDPDLGTSPREIMKKVYERAVRYAQSFAPGARSLLFSGATGLGKTFLSACIARTVADRGYSVCYVSAEALFADFEQQKFRPREGEDVTRKYLACDLLILDDLGTEMTTQFTIAALYQVVNTRLMESRATIVSTNLPVGELDRRYSAQIASRLLGAYTLYKFSGKDIRMLQKSMARPTEDMNR